MGRARVQIVANGRLSEAEALWYDTGRWSTFIDGFGHLATQDPGWPREGTVVWDSRPGGRGRVVERVLRYALKRSYPGSAVVDFLFIRRAVRDSLGRTLRRFAIELAAEREF